MLRVRTRSVRFGYETKNSVFFRADGRISNWGTARPLHRSWLVATDSQRKQEDSIFSCLPTHMSWSGLMTTDPEYAGEEWSRRLVGYGRKGGGVFLFHWIGLDSLFQELWCSPFQVNHVMSSRSFCTLVCLCQFRTPTRTACRKVPMIILWMKDYSRPSCFLDLSGYSSNLRTL
jgi:hypothetical protein